MGWGEQASRVVVGGDQKILLSKAELEPRAERGYEQPRGEGQGGWAGATPQSALLT